MKVVAWTAEDIANLDAINGLAVVLTEIDDAGLVLREIGLDAAERVLYRSPTPKKLRGLFDSVLVAVTHESSLTPKEFERYWAQCADESREGRGQSL